MNFDIYRMNFDIYEVVTRHQKNTHEFIERIEKTRCQEATPKRYTAISSAIP